jgi:hypothetical protein
MRQPVKCAFRLGTACTGFGARETYHSETKLSSSSSSFGFVTNSQYRRYIRFRVFILAFSTIFCHGYSSTSTTISERIFGVSHDRLLDEMETERREPKNYQDVYRKQPSCSGHMARSLGYLAHKSSHGSIYQVGAVANEAEVA